MVSPSLSVEGEAAQVSVEPSNPGSGDNVTVEITGVLFSTVTEPVSFTVPPSESVAVAVQITTSPFDTVGRDRVIDEPDPMLPPPATLQAYVIVGESPSSSLAVAAQDIVESTRTPDDGEMATDEIVGSVLPTSTLSVSTALPPSASLAVAVQVIVVPGDVVLFVRAKLEVPPKVVTPSVHS